MCVSYDENAPKKLCTINCRSFDENKLRRKEMYDVNILSVFK